MNIFSLAFWKYAGERAVKTAAQAALAVLGTGSLGLLQVDFIGLVSTVGAAGLASVLTSIINFKE